MIVDPRQGDIEDDASSTKSHSLLSLAGSLLVEVSLPKLIVAWLLLVILPAIIVGLSPLIVTAWIAKIGGKISTSLFGIVPLAIIIALLAIGWMFGRKLFHLAEASFWSLNALAIEPAYTMCREILRHVAEWMLPESVEIQYRERMRAWAAALAGVLITAVAVAIFLLAWPHSRWIGESADLLAPRTLAWITLANTLVLASAYLAVAALFWAFADMTMPPPRDLVMEAKPSSPSPERTWRVAHLSDLHIVGERYGFRIESGRAGPQGNARVRRVFDILEGIHAAAPLDLILISGDATDAGRASEWAEFLDIVADFPTLRDRVFILPGNHDLNIVDRANPARLDLSIGPNSRLRKIRTLSAINTIQGTRVRVVDRMSQRLGKTLSDKLKDRADQIARFADTGRPAFSTAVSTLWNDVFPMAVPPRSDDGLGLILLNSNSDSHFSFTNALGMVPEEQMRGIEVLTRQYPRALWLIGLHHHVIEYPRAAKVLSERIGTALVNGNWFLRRLQPLASRAVLMHGHRHIDWIGECGGIVIVSAPSPVMEATNDLDTYFYIHTLEVTEKRTMRLLQPQRICVPGERTKPEEESEIDNAGKGSTS